MQTLTTVYFQGREHSFLNNIAIDELGVVVAYDTWRVTTGSTEYEDIKTYLKTFVHLQCERWYYAVNTIEEVVACRL